MKKKQPEQLDMWSDDDLSASATPNINSTDSIIIDKKTDDQLSFLSVDDVPCALCPILEQEQVLEPVFPAVSLLSSNQFNSKIQAQANNELVIISESSLPALQQEQPKQEYIFNCDEIFFNFSLLSKEEQKLMKKIARELCTTNEESISLAKVLDFSPNNPKAQLCFQPITDVVMRFKQKIRPTDDDKTLEQFLQTRPILKVEEHYFAPNRENLVNLYFHLALLTDVECKLLTKAASELKLHRDTDISVAHILYDWKPQWSRTMVCGIPVMEVFNPFKEKINRELNHVIDVIKSNVYDFLVVNSIFRLNQEVELSMEKVDTILNKDLTLFLANIDEKKRIIISRNLGLDGCAPEPFRDIAPDFDMTGSRTHQIALETFRILKRSLSITPSTILHSMQANLNQNIQQYYPKLAGHFAGELEFFYFLEILMDIPKGQLKTIIYPNLNVRFLEDWFLTNPAPMPVDTAIKLLFDKYGVNQQQAINALNCAVSENLFELDGQMITPRKLGKIESVVQALLAFPRGANFRQIHELANEQGFGTHKFVEERIDHGITSAVDAGWIYLSDRGGYKHINYLPFDEQRINAILEKIYLYLIDHPSRMEGVNLKFDVYKNILDLQRIDYFDVRHVIRMHGHKKGIHFYGQSNRDTLSLKTE